MSVTIYHNPRCSKSRDALRFLNDSGLKPTIMLYLDAGWTAEILVSLKQSTDLGWEKMLRADAARELTTAIANADNKKIIDYVIKNPVALERPFVTTAKGTRPCRPLTALLEIIDERPRSPWLTEKGEEII